jgi:hypothetical protein
MFTTAFEYPVSGTDRRGTLLITGGGWDGDVCTFEFGDGGTGMSGVVRCDWRASEPEIVLHDAGRDPRLAAWLLAQLRPRFAGFHTGAFAGVGDDAIAALYSGDYHVRQGYAVASPLEAARKARLAQLTVELTSPRKVLVAGCSAGECLRRFEALGVDAHGFDVAPDLLSFAYPDVAARVRVGRVEAIPFEHADGFDVLTALDVFEHVPEDRIDAMVGEFRRIGLRAIDGHVTLRPLSWWDAKLAPHFVRQRVHDVPPILDPARPDPTTFLRVWRAATR